MRKTNVFLIVALGLALLASFTLSQVSVLAQGAAPVGVVVAYTPGQSITIVDHAGVQHEYQLSTSLKILPPGSESKLVVGSFVTIIAPASFGNNRQTAMGIVVHPGVPEGWNLPASSPTVVSSETAVATFTETPTGVASMTETTTATAIVTATDTETPAATETATALGTATDTATPTATPMGGAATTATTQSFIEWLKALFQQWFAGK